MRSYWSRVGLSSKVTGSLKETHREKRLWKEASHVENLIGRQ